MPISDKVAERAHGQTERGEKQLLWDIMWTTIGLLFMTTCTILYVISVIVFVSRGK